MVLSCDNSLPHLLTDDDIRAALVQMHSCLHSGGGCLLTLRDYEAEPRGRGLFKPYGVREENDKRYFLFQVWDFDGDVYDLSMFFVEEGNPPRTHVAHSKYYAIHPDHMATLLSEAGFQAVTRHDDWFYQPLLVGTKT